MLLRSVLISCCLAFTAFGSAYGQQYLYQTLTVKDGLPSDYVTALFFDRQGICWIGTDKGICRYDGQTFQNLTTDDGLDGNLIYTITQDKQGNIWAGGHQTGLVCITQNGDTPKVSRVYHQNQGIDEIKIDRKGRWWIKLPGASLHEYTWTMTENPAETWQPVVTFKQRNGADVDSNGTVWFHPKSPITWAKDWTFKQVAPFGYDDPAKNNVLVSGTMVAVTSKEKTKLFKIVDTTQAIELVLPDKAGANANVRFLARKGDALFYKSMDGALLVRNNKPAHIISGANNNSGYSFISAAADAYGNFYFGQFGKGMLVWRNNYIAGHETGTSVLRVSVSGQNMIACTQTMVYTAQSPFQKINAAQIPGVPYLHFVAHHQPSVPILATHGKLHGFSGRLFPLLRTPFSDYSDLLTWHGRSYISSYSAGLASFGNHDPEPKPVKTTIPIPKGIERLRADSLNLYLLTLGHGFFSLSYPSLETTQISKTDGLLSNIVYDVWRQQDTLWVGTAGGLNKYVHGQVTTFGQHEGLAGTKIIAVFRDRMGRLWALSDRYLHLVVQNHLYAIRSHPVLVDRNTYVITAAYQPASDQLWIGTNHSLQWLDMGRVIPDSESLPVVLQRIQSGGERLGVSGSFELVADHEPLVFYIQSPKYSIYTRPQVYLRVLGLDTNWRPLDPDGQFRLNRLPAGSYTLEVKAQGPDLGMMAAKSLVSFEVLPPWWKSGWFLVLAVSTAALIAFGISRRMIQKRFQQRLQQIQAEQAIQLERNRISRELHDNVGSMLTLMINRLEDNGYQPPSNRHQPLATIARNTLSQLRDAIWALDKSSLTMAQWTNRSSQYLQQLDSDDTVVTYQFDWPQHTKLSPVKALHTFRIMQEACTNALKHSGTATINVRGEYENHWFKLTISDEGKGFDPKTIRMGYGLKNMEKRAAEISAQFMLGSTPGSGTAIILKWLPDKE